MSDQQRLILAITCSLLIVFGWQHFFMPAPEPIAVVSQTNSVIEVEKDLPAQEIVDRNFNEVKRIPIENSSLSGSINLEGARIDDIKLKNFKESLSQDSSNIRLLAPSKSKEVYFIQFGWLSDDKSTELPNSQTIWQQVASDSQTIKLSWVNNQGTKFTIEISNDNNYMFDVKQSVENKSKYILKLQPYSLISRSVVGVREDNMIIHEGAIGVFDSKLKEISFKDMKQKTSYTDQNGWLGFSDKYWLTAIISNDHKFNATFSSFKDKDDRYQADAVFEMQTIEQNEIKSISTKLFIGAKKLELLDKYEQHNIKLFDRAVDFGWLYFITKPIFLLLNYFYSLIGNFGFAILLLTVFIKLLLFPLAYKGFKGMNKLKDLQPQMTALKEKHKDDPMVFQKSLMDLYKKEKVNPVSGCLPILLQMPIFFALYKVLNVSIEMRHAHFIGWIKDLSAPDPLNVFNLFGLLPYELPSFLHIGIFPIIMAATMYVQQRLSPEPSDPIQAKVMKMIPWIFMFMFASFPSGLLIYWSWSNLLSIIQQIMIKKMTTSSKSLRVNKKQ